ncbi:MAG: hypothetical protein HBSAPP02_18250 [Phycisphaerae bacterium]|nr:MAG: hypothetical protein HBSAPP02_18250 [Phycisphaerae bacterium]
MSAYCDEAGSVARRVRETRRRSLVVGARANPVKNRISRFDVYIKHNGARTDSKEAPDTPSQAPRSRAPLGTRIKRL